MTSNNYFILGLSGVTCGGKSTLSKLISEHYKDLHIEYHLLDNYFWTDQSKLTYIPHLDYYDYDELKSLDWDRYYEDALTIIKRFKENKHSKKHQQMLILDGFVIFNVEKIRKLCDLKYFYILPYEISQQRRAVRIYDPPDVPGYFDEYAWPAYLKFKKETDAIKDKEDIVYIDGTQSPQDIFSQVSNDIDNFLKIGSSKS